MCSGASLQEKPRLGVAWVESGTYKCQLLHDSVLEAASLSSARQACPQETVSIGILLSSSHPSANSRSAGNHPGGCQPVILAPIFSLCGAGWQTSVQIARAQVSNSTVLVTQVGLSSVVRRVLLRKYQRPGVERRLPKKVQVGFGAAFCDPPLHVQPEAGVLHCSCKMQDGFKS